MSKALFRDQLELFKPYIPGKPIEEVKKEFGIDRIDKLASNENPLGPSPKALEAITREMVNINIYPDPSASALREAIAKECNVTPENVVVCSGGEQVLQVIAQTFINEGDEAIMADTTFDLYNSSVSFLGGVPVTLPLKNYKHDVEGFVKSITDKTKIIYICSPNNPTGNVMPKEDVEYLLNNVPEDVVLFFDEAYYDYAKLNPEYPDSIEILKKRPNTVILRTFSKISGIAAIRVGYAITSLEIAGQMSKIRPTFGVNKLAQAAALGALMDKEHIMRSVELNCASMKMMEEYFEKMNLEYIKSSANFVFVNAGLDSRFVFQKLMEKGIIIRPGFNWGWDNWLRISTGTIEQTRLFIEKLDDILQASMKNVG